MSSSPRACARAVKLGMRPGGFGIFMTRRMADEVIYNEEGNEVLLIKYVQCESRT